MAITDKASEDDTASKASAGRAITAFAGIFNDVNFAAGERYAEAAADKFGVFAAKVGGVFFGSAITAVDIARA